MPVMSRTNLHTVVLVASPLQGYLKSLDWVALVLPHPFPAFSRLDLDYTKDSLCSNAKGLGFESHSSFLSLDSVTLVSVIVMDRS